MSKHGEIYTTSKDFTLPAVTAVTNFTSASPYPLFSTDYIVILLRFKINLLPKSGQPIKSLLCHAPFLSDANMKKGLSLLYSQRETKMLLAELPNQILSVDQTFMVIQL